MTPLRTGLARNLLFSRTLTYLGLVHCAILLYVVATEADESKRAVFAGFLAACQVITGGCCWWFRDSDGALKAYDLREADWQKRLDESLQMTVTPDGVVRLDSEWLSARLANGKGVN